MLLWVARLVVLALLFWFALLVVGGIGWGPFAEEGGPCDGRWGRDREECELWVDYCGGEGFADPICRR